MAETLSKLVEFNPLSFWLIFLFFVFGLSSVFAGVILFLNEQIEPGGKALLVGMVFILMCLITLIAQYGQMQNSKKRVPPRQRGVSYHASPFGAGVFMNFSYTTLPTA